MTLPIPFSTRVLRLYALFLRKRASNLATGNIRHQLEFEVRYSHDQLAEALEFSEKLLRKAIKRFKLSPRAVDAFTAQDLIRHAGLHGLSTVEQVERFLVVRKAHTDRKNETWAGYSEAIAPMQLHFADDLESLADRMNAVFRACD